MSLSGSSSLGAVGSVAGVAAPTAGSGFSCALRLLQLVQSHWVLRLRYLLELVILLLPAAVPGELGFSSVRWIPALVGVVVARPAVGPTAVEEASRVEVSCTCAFFSSSCEALSVFLGFSRLWIRFSSSHFWSLLHWRRLNVVLPTSAVDCCLSGLRAGVYILLWQRRFSARVLMVACLPLLRVGRPALSHVPLMLCASTSFPVNPGLF